MSQRSLNGTFPFRALACLVATATTIGFTAAPGRAQEHTTRLRVVARGARPMVGAFGGLRGDTLTLIEASPRGTRAVALSDVVSLKRSMGPHGHALAGAGIGFGAGALLGLIAGTAIQPREGSGSDVSFAAGGALLAGLAGAGIGALLGANSVSEAWRPVSASELRVLMGFDASGRPGVMLATRF